MQRGIPHHGVPHTSGHQHNVVPAAGQELVSTARAKQDLYTRPFD